MWNEPVRGSFPDPAFYSLPGIEQARAYLRGFVRRSPLAHLTGLRVTQLGSGSATFTLPASPWLQVPDGTLDVQILLERSLNFAVLTSAPPASDVIATSLSVNHLRPCTLEGESFIARATVTHTGPTFILAEVRAEDASGRAVAQATGTYVIRLLDPLPPPLSGPLSPVDEPSYAIPDPYLRPLTAEITTKSLLDKQGALAVVRAVLAGDAMAPLHELLGLRFVEADEGHAVIGLRTSEWLCSRTRQVAAGPIASLAHYGLAGVVSTLAPPGHVVGIIDQSIDFLRRVQPDGRELLARGRIVHQVGEFHVSSVDVVDADGKLVAFGHQNSVVVPRRRRAGPSAERVLATVVFTDIVGSTRKAEELGDSAWKELLAQHDAVVRRQLQQFKGREVKTTGDGFLATFDSPGRALQCARAVRDATLRLGIELRVGLHSGECEIVGADVAGIAVHVASRVQSLAAPSEILLSGTVRDLVSGSGFRFSDRGRHQLKGIDGQWQLFALEGS